MQYACPIKTYVINLKHRTDRKISILEQFNGKEEFFVNIVPAHQHPIGAIGLWNTIRHILQDLTSEEDEFVLICEDDHQFTDSYSKKTLFNCIADADKNEADVLSGGVSWFGNAFQISKEMFWMESFSGFQFTVLFKRFYKPILEANFTINDAADLKISTLTKKAFFIYPFISIQKAFGYSDVTYINNVNGRIDSLFSRASGNVQNIIRVGEFYKTRLPKIDTEIYSATYENITIPTYIINLPERTERREHIEKQFTGRSEFDITIVEACKHDIGRVGLWHSIRKIIEMAMINEDDVIVICEDDHEFTEHYSKDAFFKNITEFYQLGAEILCGGIGGFNLAVPVTKNGLWINAFYCTQFIVLYKGIFQKILDEHFDDTVTADGVFSVITSNKIVIFPFISLQRDFGYSDATPLSYANNGIIMQRFNNTSDRLSKIIELFK